MIMYRFFFVVLLMGCIHSAVLGGTGNRKMNSQGPAVTALPYTTPDLPDMPADIPPRLRAGFSVPDTPDMPSDDTGGSSGQYLTTPDLPEMPSDEPGGGQQAHSNHGGPFPSASSLWDKALGWIQGLLGNR